MTNQPSAEQFKALSGIADQYRQLFLEKLRAFKEGEDKKLSNKEMENFTIFSANASEEAFCSCFDDSTYSTFQWLVNQPSFKIAAQELGFTPLGENGYLDRFERIVRRYTPTESYSTWWSLHHSLVRTSSTHLRYVSGVAASLHNYMTGISVRTALNGPTTVERMKSLLTEFGQLLNADWIPEESRRRLTLHITRAENCLDKDRIADIPASRRNDSDLPARLMASELIDLHQIMFSATHKRAVFHLMGLPVLDRPLEMRTIERLAKAKKVAMQDKAES